MLIKKKEKVMPCFYRYIWQAQSCKVYSNVASIDETKQSQFIDIEDADNWLIFDSCQ